MLVIVLLERRLASICGLDTRLFFQNRAIEISLFEARLCLLTMRMGALTCAVSGWSMYDCRRMDFL